MHAFIASYWLCYTLKTPIFNPARLRFVQAWGTGSLMPPHPPAQRSPPPPTSTQVPPPIPTPGPPGVSKSAYVKASLVASQRLRFPSSFDTQRKQKSVVRFWDNAD